MREIVENITRTTYEGNCPECGCEQKSAMRKSFVDVLCFNCRQNKRVISEVMMLTGAVIESVEYMNDDLYRIKIISPDGSHGILETMCDSSTIDYVAGYK